MVTRSDRIAGCVYGAAIGDALGSAFEFVGADEIERQLGSAFAWDYRPAIKGSLLCPRAPGNPTDDTAMALSVATAIASGEPLTAELFASRFLADLKRGSGRFAEIFWKGGPGNATTGALSRLRAGADPSTCGGSEAGGNGAAMRAHPVGFLPQRDDVLPVAGVQARVTHGHPAAVAAAQAVAVLVHDAIAGAQPTADLPAGIDESKFARTWLRMHVSLVRGDRLPTHLRYVDMSGWATVAAAHAISLIYADDPARAIAAAAASGRDTDTIACITGALVGSRSGLNALPQRWIDELGSREAIGRVVEQLSTMSTEAMGEAK